jgi:hypothetical protein
LLHHVQAGPEGAQQQPNPNDEDRDDLLVAHVIGSLVSGLSFVVSGLWFLGSTIPPK